MQNVRWITFGMTGSVAKTAVHFFPYGYNVSAPYPAQCHLSVHYDDLSKSVILDGARLGQPDGLFLEDAFPGLKDAHNSLFGLELTINCSQPRIELSASSCIVELVSRASAMFGTRFVPRASPGAKVATKPTKTGVAIKDSYTASSLVFVNFSDTVVNPIVLSDRANGSPEEPTERIPVPEVGPRRVVEFPFDDKFFSEVDLRECSWGLMRARNLFFPEGIPAETCVALLYRDPTSKRPVSVGVL